ncbi:hypothetical protein TRICI_003411 [Trichomonascus ciferrii]|uniref:catechol O-methyltransferase n=1 Tax=Trichomonascus ciferrii TaxID=44093 RepID=A0A642V3Y3_9ASCO|nr:hypothetical protein TRICI_003411 [Trichomonascus ciferrii]
MPEKEQKLRDFVFGRTEEELESIRGNPEKVLALIDEFSAKDFLMNIGKPKGDFVLQRIAGSQVMAELGGYMGYSAIKFASSLPSDGKYYSFEANPEFAEIAKSMVELAGISQKVEIIVGPAKQTLVEFSQRAGKPSKFDAVFIDHVNEMYLSDLRTLESLNLVSIGSVVLADNMNHKRFSHAEDYDQYLQLTTEEKKHFIDKHPNSNGQAYPGNWHIVWRNEHVDFQLDDINEIDTVMVSYADKYAE